MICPFITTFLQTLTGIEKIRCSVLMQCGNLFHLRYLMYFKYAVPGVAQIASFGSQPHPLPKFSSATQLWEEGFSVVLTCKARFVAIKTNTLSYKIRSLCLLSSQVLTFYFISFKLILFFGCKNTSTKLEKNE